MQRNWDNFSFVEKPVKKVSYTNTKQDQLLKISLCDLRRPRHEKPTISESFTKTNQKWPRWSGNETIGFCDVIFGGRLFRGMPVAGHGEVSQGLACKQAPCEGGKKFRERSVNPAAKRPLSARPARPRLHSAILP